jgi:general secretion pathway protein E
MGLTTTAAALINQMDTEKRCIGSCEEVHEYSLDGVMQTYQRNIKTVADNIHALVAQHADVIFVGDIHFAESARAAVDAALSGVLTIATIPALDAIDALRRLIGFGIDPRLAARALSGVCAQRLVHRICESCRTDDVRTANDLWAFGYRADDLAQPVTLRRGTGCEACGGKGYRGRIGIFEVLAFDDTLARLLAAGAPDDKLRDASRSTDRISMREDALRKIMAGIISLDDAQYALHRVP